MYTIQPGKTWTRYDITGDGKKDRIKVVRKKSQYDGCWNGADIYVNNTKVCAINKAFMGMSIRIITLSNGKPFLCLRGGTDNDISVFHGLYQYRNGKIVQVVNFINETYGRPVNEAKIYLSGNTVRVRTEAMSYSLGYCTTEFTYKYQKGTLLRTSNYGKYIKLNAANKRTGLFSAAKNIQAYTTPTSGSKAFVIRKNTGVKILNFWTAGNKMYIRVKNGSKTGWIKAVTFKESQGYAGSPQFSGLCIQADENKKIRCRKTSDLFLEVTDYSEEEVSSLFSERTVFSEGILFQKKYCPEKKRSQDFFSAASELSSGGSYLLIWTVRFPVMLIFIFFFLQFLFLLSEQINTCSNDTDSNGNLRKIVADIVYIVFQIIRYNEVQKTCETTPQDTDTKQDQDPGSCISMLL